MPDDLDPQAEAAAVFFAAILGVLHEHGLTDRDRLGEHLEAAQGALSSPKSEAAFSGLRQAVFAALRSAYGGDEWGLETVDPQYLDPPGESGAE